MASLNQLVRKGKRLQKRRRSFVLSLNSCPQKKGICVEIRNSVSPKKPNSAKRKVAKVKLSTGKHIIAAIPGQGS
jgi:small subunit ribosomal protein S12